MNALAPAPRLHERVLRRGAWTETWLTAVVPADGPDRQAALGVLHDRLAAGAWSRVWLFGDADATARVFPSGPPRGATVDRFLPPDGAFRGHLSFRAFVVQPAPGAPFRVAGRPGEWSAWRVEQGADAYGYVARVASPAPERVDAYRRSIRTLLEAQADLGFAPADLVRTWYFFADVLADYGAFNVARHELYAQGGVTPRRVPASTGIQGIAADGRHVVLDALLAAGPGVTVEAVANPAQSEAPSYGSLFSRAMRVRDGAGTALYVSGTASIGLAGETLHVGQPERQLDDTLDRVEALLTAGGLDRPDVVEGIAYLHPAHYRRLAPLLDGARLGALPLAVAPACVCRDELLFEIELSAWRPA